MRIYESSRTLWFYPLIYLGMQNGCIIKMDIFWYKCVWKCIWRWNKYNNSIGIQCWCSRLLYSSEIFGPVYHNQLKDNVNGIWRRGGGGNPVHFYFVQCCPYGTRWYSFSVIRYPGMASLWNTISRIKCFLTGSISSSLMYVA